jgi:hypothetical protein
MQYIQQQQNDNNMLIKPSQQPQQNINNHNQHLIQQQQHQQQHQQQLSLQQSQQQHELMQQIHGEHQLRQLQTLQLQQKPLHLNLNIQAQPQQLQSQPQQYAATNIHNISTALNFNLQPAPLLDTTATANSQANMLGVDFFAALATPNESNVDSADKDDENNGSEDDEFLDAPDTHLGGFSALSSPSPSPNTQHLPLRAAEVLQPFQLAPQLHQHHNSDQSHF